MITQMKKVSIVLLDKDKQNSLKSLKKLGIMHLSENFGLNDSVKTLEDRIKDIETSLKYTADDCDDKSFKFVEEEVEKNIDIINTLGKEILDLEEKRVKLNRDIEILEPWGDFVPSDIKFLQEKNLRLNLLEISKEEYEELPKDLIVFLINKTKTKYLIAAVGELPNNLTIFEFPEIGKTEILEAIDKISSEIVEKNNKMNELSKFKHLIIEYKTIIEDRLEFEKVKAGMGYDENFSILEGWISVDKVDKFKEKASSLKWGIAISDPIEGDDTPTLIKGNKFTSMIHPLLDFLGNVPGYWEKDVSSFFLVFFTIFFAMIIGDAGYGSLFLIGAIITNIKLKKTNNALNLLYLISVFTIIWGTITGNWFGSNLIKGIPLFSNLIIDKFDSENEIKVLCFNIALIHLVLARLTAFVKNIRDKELKAFGNIGWILVIIGLLPIVKNLVVSSEEYPITSLALTLIAIGFLFVLIFANQEKGKSFFKSLGMGFAFSPLTALDTVGVFGDIMSYIRLYAVGLAGLAVAQSFNTLALPLLESNSFTVIFGILILLVGHLFNIVMAMLSVLVHGVRLNVLEFSSHADVVWAGRKFTPFREKEIL